MKEDELERKAIEELLKEAKRGKDRAETMGPMGWMKCPLASTNKRFLINTIKNTLPPDREKHGRRTLDEEEDTGDHSGEKRHSAKHSSHPYKRSEDSRKDKKRSPSSSQSTRHRQSKSDGKRR